MDEQKPNLKTVVKEAISEHGASREAIIPTLHEINRIFGYIPPEAFVAVKDQLNAPGSGVVVSESQLFAVASFYEMFSINPVGRHVIRFCESAPCHVMGGHELFQALTETLDLNPGETSPDKKWTLMTTSCLGTCGVGPVLLIDEDIYGNVTPEQIPEILSKYQ